MSLLSPQKIILGIVVATLGYSLACAQEEEKTDNLSAVELEKLDALRLSYDLKCEDVRQKQWAEPMEKLRAGYKARMKQLVDKFSKAEDLTKALAARNAAKTDPTAETIDSKVPAVAELQEIFIDALRRIQKQRDEDLAALAKSHIAKLSAIKGKLTQAQRFDSALDLEKEIQKIMPDAQVQPKPPSNQHSKLIEWSNPDSDFEWDVVDGKVTITLYSKGEGKVVIPKRIKDFPVTCIGDNSFKGCTSLKSVTIPEGVISIGREAFQGCGSLKSVIIPESVTSIGHSAFSSCVSLQSITIPKNVSSIENYAFSGCKSLTSISLPDSITRIRQGVLSGCHKLRTITIPNSIITIEESAFNQCHSLNSVTIPESVTSIGSSAFKWCRSLKKITIPASVTHIWGWAFYDCPGLTAVTFLGDAPKIEDNLFEYSTPNIYRKEQARGWAKNFGGRPVKLIRE